MQNTDAASGFSIKLYSPHPLNSERIIDTQVIPALSQLGASPFTPSVLYVVPTRRKAELSLQYLLDKSGRAVFGNVIVTLNEFISMIYKNGDGATLLTPAARLAIIEDALKSLSPQLKFLQRPERHPGYVRKLAEIFSTFKQNNIFTAAQLNKILRAGRVSTRKAYDLAALFKEYNVRLMAENNASGVALFDEEDALSHTRKAIGSSGFSGALPHVRLLILDGFYDFNPLQQALLKEVIRTAPRVIACMEFEALPECENRRHNRIFKLPEKNLLFYKSCRSDASVEWQSALTDSPPATLTDIASQLFKSGFPAEDKIPADGCVTILAPRDATAEVTEIARRIKKLTVDGTSTKLSRIGIVIPDLESYAPLVRDIFAEHGIPFSEAAGRPLASSPVCAAVSDMIETIKTGFARQALFRFISSPFVSAPMPPGADMPLAHEIDLVAREAGISGGSGPAQWLSALDVFEKRLRARYEKYASAGAETSGAEDKIDSIRKCRAYLKSVFKALKPLGAERDVTPAEFERLLRESFSAFAFRRLVCENTGSGAGASASRANIAALLEIEEIISEMRTGLELSLPASGEDKTFPIRNLFEILEAEFIDARIHDARREPGGAQVMGLLETRGISFDAVFLCGMTDASMPRKNKEADFFLTAEERYSCGLESIRADISEDRLLFYKLFLSGAKTITITRPAWNGDRETLPSPFIGELLRHASGAESPNLLINDDESFFSLSDCVEAIGKLSARAAGPAAASAVSKVPAEFIESIALRMDIDAAREACAGFDQYRGVLSSPFHIGRIGEKTLPDGGAISVTRLESYARCPFGFFLSSILGIEPMPDIEDEITPMDRGLLLHGIIEKFYAARYDDTAGRVIPLTNSSEEIKEAERSILNIAIGLIDEFEFKGTFWNAFRDSLLCGLDGYKPASPISYPGILKSFINSESSDIDWLKPAYFESEFSLKKEERTPLKLSGRALELKLENGRTVFVRGKIDRIDTLTGKGNYFMVIDYKTGAPRTSGDLASGVTSGADLQLPLYLIMARDALGKDFTPIGAALYSLNRESLKSGKSAWFARQKFKDDKATGANAINTRSRNGFFSDDAFDEILSKIQTYSATLCSNILAGRFDNALAKKDFASCQYCDMRRVCRAETLNSPLDTLVDIEKG